MSETPSTPTQWLSEAQARLAAIPAEIAAKTTEREEHKSAAMQLTAKLDDLRAEQRTLEEAMRRLRRRAEKPPTRRKKSTVANPAPAAAEAETPRGDQ